MVRHKVPARSSRRVRYPELHDPQWLSDAISQGLSVARIAEQLGCSQPAVRNALANHDLNPAPSEERPAELDNAEWLATAHLEQHRTITDIAAALGVHRHTVAKALRRTGVISEDPSATGDGAAGP